MFQKRHYEWLAKFARANLTTTDIGNLANALERENCHFDHNRFLKASGIDPNTGGWSKEARAS